MTKRTRASSKPRPRRRRQAPPRIVFVSESEENDTHDVVPMQRRQSPQPTAVDEESSDCSIIEIEQELSLSARVERSDDDNSLFDAAVGENVKDAADGRGTCTYGDDLFDDQQDFAGDNQELAVCCNGEEEEEEEEEEEDFQHAQNGDLVDKEAADADGEDELDYEEDDDNDEAALQLVASQAVAAAAESDGEPRVGHSNGRSRNGLSRNSRQAQLEKTIAWLLDPVKRLEVRDKQFSDFVDPKFRNTSDVPKSTGKLFLRRRAEKFVSLYNQYRIVANLTEVEEHLLRVFELFIADLMNCFDHPKEVIGWNPFAALADLVEAGALIRTPEVVRSCSRLTLGADWSSFTDADRARVGAELITRLTHLHHWRMAEVNDLLVSWHGKLESRSTCDLCGTDAWEIYILTVPLALLTYGTKYIDKEAASDTSSGSDESTPGDNDSDLDDHEEDQHDERSASSVDDDFSSRLDPMLGVVARPYRDPAQTPRPPTRGLALSQQLLKNYGPNAYLLRMVSLDEFGSAKLKNAQFKVCPDCGYRFDGGTINPSSKFWRTIERAIRVAREQINAVQEFIELPQA